MSKTDPPSDGVKSAVRVLELFELLARWDAAKTHTEIAAELGIPKSSLTKLLKTLVGRRYLDYAPATKRYALGPALARLARQSHTGRGLVAIAEPILRTLTEATQETSALNLLKGDRSEVVCAALSPRRLLSTMRVGDTAPLHATSSGKALLAHLPADMRRDYLAHARFERITPRTIRSARELKTQLDKIARTGLAYVFEEFTPGIVGMARPILDDSGFPLAAVNIAMPATRFDSDSEKRCAAALERAIKEFRSRLRLA